MGRLVTPTNAPIVREWRIGRLSIAWHADWCISIAWNRKEPKSGA